MVQKTWTFILNKFRKHSPYWIEKWHCLTFSKISPVKTDFRRTRAEGKPLREYCNNPEKTRRCLEMPGGRGEVPERGQFLDILEVKWNEVTQSCPTLCDPMDCSPPGSLVHGIFQAWILEWLAISFSRGSSWTRDRTQVSHIVGRRFTVWAEGTANMHLMTDWFEDIRERNQ